MKNKLNLIHALLVLDSILNIVLHRVWLGQIEKGSVSEGVSTFLQVTIYGAFLLFMATMAGGAVFIWQKITRNEYDTSPKEEYPKVSFAVAIIAFLIFSIYWFVIV